RCIEELKEYVDLIVFVGADAYRALCVKENENSSTLQIFRELKEASSFLKRALRAGDLVLLKGSGRADHLQRLILDRYKRIQCWQEHCGFNRFCDSCSQLYQDRSIEKQDK